MKYSSQIPFAVIFWILAVVNSIGIAAGIPVIHLITKPLLIPALALFLAGTKTIIPGKKIVLIGLVFSWLGDMFLLFEDSNALFFIFGLVFFLTTHIFYIIYFLQIQSQKISLLKRLPLLVLLVIGYGVLLVWFLYPHLGGLKIPVMAYAVVICSMLLCSLHIFLKVNSPANLFYLAGAALFVCSDSLLATNKFYQSFAFAGVWIMLTYCAAQYFIVKGFIKTTIP